MQENKDLDDMTPEEKEKAAHDAAADAAEAQREDNAMETHKENQAMEAQRAAESTKSVETAADKAESEGAIFESIKTVITELKAEREKAQKIKTEIQEVEVVFREQHNLIFAQLGESSKKTAELEDQLRSLGEARFKSLNPEYSEDADLKKIKLTKDMGFGVKARISEKPDYDASAAFAWAKEKNMALIPQSLDIKKFEKLAKTERFEFVKFKNSYSITLPGKIDLEGI